MMSLPMKWTISVPAFAAASGSDEILEADRRSGCCGLYSGAIVAERRQIADRRIDPDIEILARLIGNLEAEIRRIARDVPAAQAIGKPFLQLVDDFALQAAFALAIFQPRLQHRLEVGELDEEVRRFLLDRLGARDDRVGIDQVGRVVGLAADLARIAVLVLAVAVRAFALDEAIRQEHFLDRIVQLLHRPRFGVAGGDQRVPDAIGEIAIRRAVGRRVMVVRDAEIGEGRACAARARPRSVPAA